jgi:hypothetical protein
MRITQRVVTRSAWRLADMVGNARITMVESREPIRVPSMRTEIIIFCRVSIESFRNYILQALVPFGRLPGGFTVRNAWPELGRFRVSSVFFQPFTSLPADFMGLRARSWGGLACP